MKVINNITALRLLTIATSLLFIPAFIYGVASIWSVLFAVLMAWYMRGQLTSILNKCNEVQQEDLEYWFVKKRLLLLVIEGVVILSVPALFLLFYFSEYTNVHHSVDYLINTKLQEYVFEAMPENIFTFESRFVFSTLITFLSLLLSFFLIASKTMRDILLKYYYVIPPYYMKDKNNIRVSYSLQRHMFPLLAGALPLFAYAFTMMSFDGGLPSLKLMMFFNLNFHFISYFFFILFIALHVSCKRMGQAYDRQEKP